LDGILPNIRLYLEAGCGLVLIVYSDLRKIVTHWASGQIETLNEGDHLDGGEVLPGLSIPVSALFPPAGF
jgi:hypothetical protein